MTSSVEQLLAQWIAEMLEFLQMTNSARRGLKHSCGGRLDDDDGSSHDEEATGCTAVLNVFTTVALPADATQALARSLVLEALEKVSSVQRGGARRAFEWARAVVEGRGSEFWNAYHPRRAK